MTIFDDDGKLKNKMKKFLFVCAIIIKQWPMFC